MTRGLRIAKDGADVARAAAYELVADSEWPTLNVISEGPIDIEGNFNGETITLFKHDLNYFSAFLVFEYYWQYDYTTFEKIYDYGKMRVLAGGIGNDIFNYRDKLTTRPLFGPEKIQGYYVLFDYNLEVPFSLPFNLDANPTAATSSEIGVKTLADKHSSRGMSSPNLEDYTINTRARSLTVHLNNSQLVDASTNNQLAVRHNLGYLPNAYLYQRDPISNREAIQFVNNVVSASEVNLTVRGAQSPLSGFFYYMITKEPFVLALP